MMPPTVYIIIPVFNRWKYTKRCLDSIRSQTYVNICVIVVDDGSTDGTGQKLESTYKGVKVILGNGNWWWTKCMFEGVKMARKSAKKTDFVLEMNNDCFLPKNYLARLICTAKKNPKSLIGSICVRDEKPNVVVEAGIRINWETGLVYGVAPSVSDKLQYFKNMEIVEDIDALPGKGTLIPVRVFSRIGSFDYKRLPHYIADYEFAIRAKRAGFNLIVDTHAILRHCFEATGISSGANVGMFGYKKAFHVLFGRKSMANIVDWITFLIIACPRNLLLINLYMTGWRLIYGLTSFFPFVVFRPLVIPTQNIITKLYQFSRKTFS